MPDPTKAAEKIFIDALFLPLFGDIHAVRRGNL